jgi:hypothetical protein
VTAQPQPTAAAKVVAGGIVAAVVVLAGFLGHVILQPSSRTVQLKPSAKVCAVTSVSAVTIQTAVKSCANGGIVTIPAGTFTLTNHITVGSSETVTGAGPTLTHLIQHARLNIFQITAPGVTIEDMDLNTVKYNPGIPPVFHNPAPGTIFSDQSNTHVLNLTSEAGTGFGFRLTGPNPCQNHTVSGDVVMNVVSSNHGSGGFTALDDDCGSSSTITNVTIIGDYLALYESSGVTVNGLVSTPTSFEQKCAAPIYVTGPANGDTLENVKSNGGSIVTHATRFGGVTNLTEVNDTHNPACK